MVKEELDQIRLSQETQNLVVEKEAMSLAPGSQMEEGEDMEEEDVFGRSTVLKNRTCPEICFDSGYSRRH